MLELRVVSGQEFDMRIDAKARAACTSAAAQSVSAMYGAHVRDVHTYIARRLGAELAADLTAEVFGIALRRYETFDPELGHPRAWLYGIASNLMRGHLRTEQRRLRAVEREGGMPRSAPDPLARMEEQIDADAALRRVTAAIADLPADDRDIVTLFAWEGCNYAEIAEALDINIGTVRSRLHRIRTLLDSHDPRKLDDDE